MAAAHYDLVVIGTGSGNSLFDERFDNLKIALCEDKIFGGTCLNVGCIPTKMFVYPADRIHDLYDIDRLGVNAHVNNIRWDEIVNRVWNRIDPIAAAGERYRVEDCNNIDVYGHAEFIGEKRFRVTDRNATDTHEITADRVVLAAGSRAAIPGLVAESGVQYYTNENIMRIDRVPEHLVILGSGYIATEFANVFSGMGSTVTLIGRSPVLLKHLDNELSELFTEIAREKWDVRLGQGTTAIDQVEKQREDGSSYFETTITFEDGSTVTGDAFLVATGRTPNTDRLGLDNGSGVKVERGRVVVDKYGRTTAPDVWAFGDISSPYQLKHVANAEMRAVQHNLMADSPADYQEMPHSVVPAAIFTHPQIANVGLTEEQARKKGAEEGFPVTVKVQKYGDVAYGWAMEDQHGIVKLIANAATGELLGAHILGHEASLLIQPLIQAMSFGLKVNDMARGQYWIHPALTEVIENALLGLELQ